MKYLFWLLIIFWILMTFANFSKRIFDFKGSDKPETSKSNLDYLGTEMIF